MKRLLFLLVLIPSLVHAQHYTRREIRESADTILQNVLGNRLFEACTYTHKGYYNYLDSTGKSHYAMVDKHKKTKGTIQSIIMTYNFNYNYSKCAAYNNITGVIHLQMNNELGMVLSPDISFIPSFVIDNTGCRLATKEEGIELAYKNGFKASKKGPVAMIDYDKTTKQFTWNIANRIQKDSTLQKKYIVQTIRINAGTQKVVSYTKAPKAAKPQY
ncbi:MAG: hypothetical protein H0X33_14675 [Taibaiella sp.]|nr:hypothetical protein [Taibaiella sp.]